MKHVLSCALAAAALAGTAKAAPLTPAQMRADFAIARSALQEAHGGIYRYTSKKELDRVFDRAAASLDRPLESAQFYSMLATAVAAVRCGHTIVMPSAAMEAELKQSALLPLDVALIDGRLYITRDFDGENDLAGHEIVAINGVNARHIIKRLTAASPGDGFIATSRAQRVARRFRQELYLHMQMAGSFAVTVRDAARQPSRVVQMQGQDAAALPVPARSHRFLELAFLDDGATARMTVPTFSDERELDDGITTLRKAFEEIAKAGSKSLILDLRDNGGGDDVLGKQLFAHLASAPFRYYDALTVTAPQYSFGEHVKGGLPRPSNIVPTASGQYALRDHPNLGIHAPVTPTFKGRVIALINGRSFSTTAELISHLHNARRATFVGEESGGGYDGNNSGGSPELVLPNSGVRVLVPLVTYRLAVTRPHAAGRGVVPDYPVTNSIADRLAGRDRVMDTALRIARDGK